MKQKKVAIIGAGFGGLSLAIRLQSSGFKVIIFEKNEKLGGHAYQLKKNGYTFDMGPSLITAPEIINSVFRQADRRMEDYLDLVRLNPFYRIYYHDGSVLDYSSDTEAMKEQMANFNKEDAGKYESFITYVRKLYDAVIVDGLGSTPFDIKTMIKFMPDAIRLKALLPAYSVVSNFFKDERNRFAFSFHPLFIGGNPFKVPAVYLMIPYLEKTGGVWYSRGGMYSVVEAFRQIFLEIGGEIKTGTEVQEISVKNNRANGIIASGQFFPADVVVSNAHFAHTHLNLLKPEHRRKWNNRKVTNLNYSMSSFLIYLGVKKQYPQLKHHTLILSPRYKELVEDIFERKILAEDASMYLHVPSRTDRSMAPDGSESMYVLIPVPNNLSGINWSKIANNYAQKIINLLETEFRLDGLKENIEVMELFTPDDFAHRRNNYLGSAWGLEPRMTQSAVFRPKNRSEDVHGLYMVGASTHPGAGLPGVLLSAETTHKVIMEDFGDLVKKIHNAA